MVRQAFGDEAASRFTVYTHGVNGSKTVESRRVTANEAERLQRLFATKMSRRCVASLLERPHLALRVVAEGLAHRIRRIPDPAGRTVLLRDNAPAHTATLSTRYYAKNRITRSRIPSALHSSDSAPADCFLFPKLKSKGHFFNDIPAIRRARAEQSVRQCRKMISPECLYSFTDAAKTV